MPSNELGNQEVNQENKQEPRPHVISSDLLHYLIIDTLNRENRIHRKFTERTANQTFRWWSPASKSLNFSETIL